MTGRFGLPLLGAMLLAAQLVGCASTPSGREAGDRYRLTRAEIESVDVSTLYEVVQRLRPRWLEVRAPRGMHVETEIVVVLDRTLLGRAHELRGLGVEIAAWLEYVPGTQAQSRLPMLAGRHVEGAIVVHTRDPGELN